jgi:hypothetical protein
VNQHYYKTSVNFHTDQKKYPSPFRARKETHKEANQGLNPHYHWPSQPKFQGKRNNTQGFQNLFFLANPSYRYFSFPSQPYGSLAMPARQSFSSQPVPAHHLTKKS